METPATFDEKAYESLEREFMDRVEEDNKKFEEKVREGKYRGIYLPNVRPTSPVDYVLVGMEPSLGGWAKDQDDAREKIADGFRNGVGRTLQFCIDTYLCRNGETWYLTDLAKGAMLTKSPDAGSMEKYKAWYPLLEKELKLVAKSDARVIAIGRTVDGFLNGFLNKTKLCGRVYVGWIPHYSTQVAGQRGKMIKGREKEYENFAASLQDSKWAKSEWTPSEKNLLFDYKILFERIRDQKNLYGEAGKT